MCPELMLIIEVDGITHLNEDVIDHDEIRQTELEVVGFKVIRFQDGEVLNDMKNVERVLESFVDEFELGNSSSPCPLQRGTFDTWLDFINCGRKSSH